MNPEFKRGDRVRVTFEGTYAGLGAAGELGIDVATGECAWVTTDAPGVTIERIGPDGWPPQAGDEWRVGSGSRWFALLRPGGIVAMRDVLDDTALWINVEEWRAEHEQGEDGRPVLTYRLGHPVGGAS